MGWFRLAAVFALLLSGLAVAAGVTAGAAAASTGPGHTIASAGTLTIGDSVSGGGGPIDFWKISLHGGDQVQFLTTTPAYSTYVFSLYAPGTSDATFPQAKTFSTGTTNYLGTQASSVVDLQAPYNGTFILAVCENVANNDCTTVDGGSGTNPMNPYTFSTSYITRVSPTVAAKEVQASPDIAGARGMGIGDFEAGGAGPIDFWKVSLRGGEVVQFLTRTPAYSTYVFSLYAPGTSDATFPQAKTFSTGTTNYLGTQASSVVDLQAPYNGTFILAVCENVANNDCTTVDGGSGTNPMNPYTFKTSFATFVPAGTAAAETRANPTIAGVRQMLPGHFEAGGGSPIDFWKVPLNGGDRVQFNVTTPPYTTYVFALYKGSTTDATFPQAVPVSTQVTNYLSVKAKSVVVLHAPFRANFILAVCENVNNNDCTTVDGGSGTNPMDPYTFTLRQTGGLESRTYLSLSAHTVRYGHERGLKFHVHVVSVYGGTPTGRVYVSDGKATVCSAVLVRGWGTCAPPANTKIRVGRYWMTAYYHGGNRYNSASGRTALTVRH